MGLHPSFMTLISGGGTVEYQLAGATMYIDNNCDCACGGQNTESGGQSTESGGHGIQLRF